MRAFLEILMDDPYIWAVITILGLVLGYLGISRNKYKQITYAKKTNRIISLKKVSLEALHLFYNFEEIKDVAITRIAVWSSGNDPIKPIDFANRRLLTIGVKEGCRNTTRILNCAIDFKSEDKNGIKIIPGKEAGDTRQSDDEAYTFSFDYLEKKDGMVVQIIHTGKADDLYLDCRIIGGKETIELAQDTGIYLPMTDLNSLPVMKWFSRVFKRFNMQTKVSRIQAALYYYLVLLAAVICIALIMFCCLHIDALVKAVLQKLLACVLIIPSVLLIVYVVYILFNQIPKKINKEF